MQPHPLYVEDRLTLAWLTTVPGVGTMRLRAICSHLPKPSHVWDMSEADFGQIPLFTPELIHNLCAHRRDFPLSQVERDLTASSVQVVSWTDATYPALLRQIDQPPWVLFVEGSLAFDAQTPYIGIVGTRRPSAYGLRETAYVTESLAAYGAVIVSGLARGIDRAAHDAALRASTPTIAVLGSGHQCIYPKDHITLSRSIAQSGLVISEYYPTVRPHRGHFPARNRLISGLSWGIVVVEAGAKSGALITADCALEQNREVFAVPGPLRSPNSIGTHRLIRQGAACVSTPADIVKEFPEWAKSCAASPTTSGEAAPRVPGEEMLAALSTYLKGDGATIDEIRQHFPSLDKKLHSCLLQWQLEGFVREEVDGRFVWIGR